MDKKQAKKANPWWYTNGLPPDDRMDEAVLAALESVPKRKKGVKKTTPKKAERSKERLSLLQRFIIIKGGPGSGHFGHVGRPGEVGGSVPSLGPTEASVAAGYGVAVSIFSKGKYARVRQYLRSQGLSTKDTDRIVASGAADTGALGLVGHRGGLAQKMGQAEVQPIINKYAGVADLEARMREGKPLVGDEFFYRGVHGERYKVVEVNVINPSIYGPHDAKWIIVESLDDGTQYHWMEDDIQRVAFVPAGNLNDTIVKLGGDPAVKTIQEKVAKLSPDQQRWAQGRLQVGEKFQQIRRIQYANSFREEIISGGPLEVADIDGNELLVVDSNGDYKWWSREDIQEYARKYQAPKTVKIGKVMTQGVPPWRDDDTLSNLMATGVITEKGRPPRGGISTTYLGELEDGTKILSKVSSLGKNVSEKMVWDITQHYLPEMEGMATKAVMREGEDRVIRVLADAENWATVAVERYGGNNTLGKQYMKDTYEALIDIEQFKKMGVYDALSGNTDRHGNNMMIGPDGNLFLVDNDFGFNDGWASTRWEDAKGLMKSSSSRYQELTGERFRLKASDLDSVIALQHNASFKDYVTQTASRGYNVWEQTEKRLIALENLKYYIENNYGTDGMEI